MQSELWKLAHSLCLPIFHQPLSPCPSDLLELCVKFSTPKSKFLILILCSQHILFSLSNSQTPQKLNMFNPLLACRGCSASQSCTEYSACLSASSCLCLRVRMGKKKNCPVILHRATRPAYCALCVTKTAPHNSRDRFKI